MLPTTIVVPCFNEAARLPEARFRAFVESVPGVDFLFVNDGSTDGTLSMLRALADRDVTRFRVLSLDLNRGKAEAVREGVCAAMAGQPRPDCVGFWDADLATPLDAIPRLVAVLEDRPEVQMIFGARVKLLGRAIERSSLRHYPEFKQILSILEQAECAP